MTKEQSKEKYNAEGKRTISVKIGDEISYLAFWKKQDMTPLTAKKYVSTAYDKGFDHGKEDPTWLLIALSSILFLIFAGGITLSWIKSNEPFDHVDKARCSDTDVVEVLAEYPDGSKIWQKTNLDLCKHWKQP
jgi:hypothetical protein